MQTIGQHHLLRRVEAVGSLQLPDREEVLKTRNIKP
jgi:hypothetical protein